MLEDTLAGVFIGVGANSDKRLFCGILCSEDMFYGQCKSIC